MSNHIKTRMEKKKFSWPECIRQLKEMSEAQERNINQALINEGPYGIRPKCQWLIIPAEKWLGMSKEQKERKLREFQKVALSKAFGFSSSATTSSISSILEAATEGMPSSSGKKPGQSGRRGGRRSLSSPRETTGFRPRITVYWRAFLGRQGHKWVPAKGNSQRLAVIYAYRYEWVPRASVIWASVHMHLDKRHEGVHVLQMLLSTQAQANWSANWCAAPCTLWCYLLPPGAEYVENQSWRSLLLSAASECLLPFKENMCVKEKQTLCHKRSMC